MKSRRWRRLAAAGSLAAAGLGVAGIATLTSVSTAAASSKPTLVVYSAQGYDSATVKAFLKTNPGFNVTLDDNSTGPLLTQIQATKNHPNWGVLWVDGATAFAELDKEGLLVRGWKPSVTYNALGRQSEPTNHSYYPAGVTLVGTMIYNKAKVKHVPTTFAQLAGSQYKNEVGMDDPSQSGPTFPFVAGIMNYLGGVSKGETYFAALKHNGLKIHPTNGPTLAALAAGQINIALVQSSAAIGAAKSDTSLAIKYLKPATLLPSALGIDAKMPAAVRAEAKKFVDFVFSAKGQSIMKDGDPTGDSLFYPVKAGVQANPGLPDLAKVKTQTINPYLWGPREASINSWFTSHIVN